MRLCRLLIITMTALVLLRSGFAYRSFHTLLRSRRTSAVTVNVPHRQLALLRETSANMALTPRVMANTGEAVLDAPVLHKKRAPKASKPEKAAGAAPVFTKVKLDTTALDPKIVNHPILRILNEDQVRAATSFIYPTYTREDFVSTTSHVPKVTMVLAGAGSGKTRVLVHRIAYLLKELNVSPNAILATTFTNKAAREIKERIHALMYPDSTPKEILTMAALLEEEERCNLPQWLGTFHSLCYKILLYNSKLADMEGCNMIDEGQQRTVVKKIMDEWEEMIRNMKLDYDAALKKCLQVINRHKDNGRRAHAASVRLGDTKNDEDWLYQRVYEAYEKHCIDKKLIDFNEVLLRTYELFVRHPEVLQRYRRQFEYIHVDEFQDTNGVQYCIVKLLVDGPAHPKTNSFAEPFRQGPSLFVVGDDDQAIYGFRGAKADIMQQVGRDYPHCALIKLEQNYRSTHTILRAANSVINMNKIRLGKLLWTGKEAHVDEKVHVYKADSEFDEADYVASEILKRTSAGLDGAHRKHTHTRAKVNEKRDFSLADVAILVRTRIQIMTLERALLQNRIPYRIRGGHSFYQKEEVQQVLMYLKLVEDRHNNVAFQRIVNFPPRGVTTKLLEEVEAYASTEGVSLWDAAVALTQRALNPTTPVDGAALEVAEGGADTDSDTDTDTVVSKESKTKSKVKKPKKVKAKAVPKTVLQLTEFLRTIDHIHALTDRLHVHEAVKVAIMQSGVHEYYVAGSLKPTKQSTIHERKVEHLSDFAALVDARGDIGGFEDNNWTERYNNTVAVSDLDSIRVPNVKRDALNRTPMQVFLDETTFDEDHSDKISNTTAHRAVQIFTIHGVKGLEFPVVFLCGAEEGILPISNARNRTAAAELAAEEVSIPDIRGANSTISYADKVEEESRRLFYVALTRAREVLYITHAATRKNFSAPFRKPPKISRSRFLDEMDQDVILNAKFK